MTTRGLVAVRGGGDLGTGVAHRLHRAGYRVFVLEVERPTAVRRRAAFAQAVLDGETTVEGVSARRTTLEELAGTTGGASPPGASGAAWGGWIPVMVDAGGEAIARLDPAAVVDARMLKTSGAGRRDGTRLTIGLGPGPVAGRDVDLVIETARGHHLGRVIEEGAAELDTGVPGDVGGVGADRVIRAPSAGRFASTHAIGDTVERGEVVGTVDGAPARARTAGLLRGLVADGVRVREGQKLGDVDPRGRSVDPAAISDKARAVAGAVLEGLLGRGVLPFRAEEGS